MKQVIFIYIFQTRKGSGTDTSKETMTPTLSALPRVFCESPKYFWVSLFLTSFFLLSSIGITKAQNDLSSPTSNILTIPTGSIIIPMDSLNYYTVSGSKYFNLNSYGLLITLLDSSIAIHWYIKAGKSKDGIDFTASMQQYAPTSSGTTVSKNLRAGPMVIFPTDSTGAWAAINAFNNRVSTSSTGRTKTKINVYKTTSAISADCRYVLTEKPSVAVLNDGGFASVQTQFFVDANVPASNYTTIPGHDLMSGCYTIATQPHNTTALAQNLDSIQSFLNQGGNFFAECRGLLNYENFTPSSGTAGFFQTTHGVTLDNVNTTISYPNPDVAYSQFLGQFNATTIGGGEQIWVMTPASGSTPASTFKNSGYSVVSNGTPSSGTYKIPHYSATVAKILSNNVAGGVMFYGGGHDYSSSSGSGVDYFNGERMYFNTVLTPCGTRGFCSSLFFWINLSVTQTATTPCYQDTVIITVKAKNNGPSSKSATGVIVYDTIPAGFTYVGYTTTKGTYNSCTGKWTIGNMAELDSEYLYLKAIANTTTTTKITAHIDGNQYDTYNSNDTNSVYIKVNSLPAASVASNTTICSGASVSIGSALVSGDTYSWTSSPSGFTSTLSNPSVNPSTTTTYTVKETKTSTGCYKSNLVTVTVNTLPAAAVIANTSICTGTSKAIGAIAVSGSTYSWVSSPVGLTSTSANPTVSPTLTTTYTLTETNSNGCIKSNSVTITVNTLPAASVISNASICTGSSISIGTTAVSGSTYAWTSSPVGFTSTSSNPTVSTTVTSTYTLTETNSNGCVKSNSVTVTVLALPAAAIIASRSLCTGSSVSIGATAVSGSTYAWTSIPTGYTSTSSNPTVSPNVNTNYTLIETGSSGCTKTNSVTISVNPLPLAMVVSNSAICSGASISIGATSVSGSIYAWVSSPAAFTSTLSNPSVSPSVTTTYTLTETNINGCVNSNSVTITVNPLPLANVISGTSICTGSSIAIGATSVSGNTYVWVGSPAGFTSTSSNPTVSPTVNTTYTLTETITATGCTKSNSATITVNALPAAAVISNTSICTGASKTIGAMVVIGSTYAWVSSPAGFTSSSANPTVSPIVNTTYTLTETNSTGCIKSNSLSIIVNDLPAAAIIGSTSICSGSAIGIGATSVSGSTYAWTSSPAGFTATSANPTVSPIVTTTYTLTETNSNGCIKSNSVTISVKPLPAAAVISNSGICIGSSISIGASSVSGSTYSWTSFPIGFTSTASNPMVSPTVSTTYTITETGSNGCSKSSSVIVTVNPFPNPIITGNTSVCVSTNGSIYSTSSVSGDTYMWNATKGNIFSGQNTNTVQVNWGAISGTGTIAVTETNSSTGCAKTVSSSVILNALPGPKLIYH